MEEEIMKDIKKIIPILFFLTIISFSGYTQEIETEAEQEEFIEEPNGI